MLYADFSVLTAHEKMHRAELSFMNVLLSQELTSIIENLRTKLLAERRRNLVQEMEIRKEMGDAMLKQLMESEELRRWGVFCFLTVMQICGIARLQFSVLGFDGAKLGDLHLVKMFSRQIEKLKESYQEKLENTFEMYKDAIKEHAYQSAMTSLEDDYVPLGEFIAEQEKVEVSHKNC